MTQAIVIVVFLGLLYLAVRIAWFVVRTAFRIVVRGSGTAIGHMEKANADLAVRTAQAKADAGKVVPNRRRWALALGDILLLRNGLRCDSDTLALDVPAEQRQRLAKQVLRSLNAEDARQAARRALAGRAAADVEHALLVPQTHSGG